jgi:hypothetical protein
VSYGQSRVFMIGGQFACRQGHHAGFEICCILVIKLNSKSCPFVVHVNVIIR